MIKKGDILLSVAILVAAAGLFWFNILSGSNGERVRVTVDGSVYAELLLSGEHTETVKTEYGTNVLVIKNGSVSVAEADCPDGYCKSHVAISSSGETIVCLPHRLVVEIVGGSDE